jgi:hypothetical protein
MSMTLRSTPGHKTRNVNPNRANHRVSLVDAEFSRWGAREPREGANVYPTGPRACYVRHRVFTMLLVCPDDRRLVLDQSHCPAKRR